MSLAEYNKLWRGALEDVSVHGKASPPMLASSPKMEQFQARLLAIRDDNCLMSWIATFNERSRGHVSITHLGHHSWPNLGDRPRVYMNIDETRRKGVVTTVL